jgi:hypothetical protein
MRRARGSSRRNSGTPIGRCRTTDASCMQARLNSRGTSSAVVFAAPAGGRPISSTLRGVGLTASSARSDGLRTQNTTSVGTAPKPQADSYNTVLDAAFSNDTGCRIAQAQQGREVRVDCVVVPAAVSPARDVAGVGELGACSAESSSSTTRSATPQPRSRRGSPPSVSSSSAPRCSLDGAAPAHPPRPTRRRPSSRQRSRSRRAPQPETSPGPQCCDRLGDRGVRGYKGRRTQGFG